MEHLFDKLKKYSESDIYPYHMPGHKRQPCGDLPEEICRIDITEIDGFDNLHQPEELLKDLQDTAAKLYGAKESFYLVNGSTCGILSAISAAVPFGGHILMARNCHKSAYHAAYLRNLIISYLYSTFCDKYDIFDAVTPKQVQEALEEESDIDAVFLVSPTYEGRLADVKAIAEIVHAKGIPLIVDEAHGAHLGLAEGFAPNSCQMGADLVIQSVHKTLPSMTQTALLHVNGSLVDPAILKRFLRIYQTSSPSYVLMASIDNALQYVGRNRQEIFARFKENFEKLCGELCSCKHLSFLPCDWTSQDVGKLVISVKGTSLTGKELYDILLEKYHLQMEMAAETFVLAMFTVNDREEAYQRMRNALLEIDGELSKKSSRRAAAENGTKKSIVKKAAVLKDFSSTCALPLYKAWDRDKEEVELKAAVGRIVAEFVNLYPPGIPLLVPGEYITEDMVSEIQAAVEQGLTVQGVSALGKAPLIAINVLK